jgi:hypothetical protein
VCLIVACWFLLLQAQHLVPHHRAVPFCTFQDWPGNELFAYKLANPVRMKPLLVPKSLRLCTNVCTQMFVKVLCTYDLHPCARQRHTCIHTHLHVHTRTYVHSFTHSLTHSLTYSLTHSHTHSLTHSLTHSCLRSRKESICTHFGVRPISGLCERSKVPETST